MRKIIRLIVLSVSGMMILNNAQAQWTGTSPGGTSPQYLNAGATITNGSVLFSGQTGSTPVSGAGARLMWIPAKRAFRAGEIPSTEWDEINIGLFSFAAGYGTKASSNYSTAFGRQTTASSFYSSSFNYFTTASGSATASFGWGTTAQAFSSIVMGRYNIIAGTTNSWVNTDPLFVVGNGTSSSARANAFTLLKNGQAFFGTNYIKTGIHTNYKLAVDGKIVCKELIVTLTDWAVWPDYVFKPGYKLMPLLEVEKFVNENSHLPGVPSEKEIKENGISVSETNATLLKKVEELTLYMIEMKKENDQMKNKISILEENIIKMAKQ